MAAQKRRTRTSVKDNLFEDACGFNFFKAVHLLEGYSQDKQIGKLLSPKKDAVRFRVEPGFSFPASDIQALQNGHAHPKPVMTVNFMGLIGPNGVLPQWYNAYAQERNHGNDFSMTDFMDMFHHRLISLFYRAWKKYRLAENYSKEGTDPITKTLSRFVGMGEEEEKADSEFAGSAKRRLIYFTGLASRSVPTTFAIETVIANATGVPVNVEQFVERMIPIHDEDKTCLGRANGTLKKNALCGSRFRDVSSFFWVELGPMPWKKYMAFQPRSRNLEMVKKLIAYISGIEYEFKIRLILKGPDIPSMQLGGGKTGEPILGRTVMLKRPHKPYKKDVRIRESEKVN